MEVVIAKKRGYREETDKGLRVLQVYKALPKADSLLLDFFLLYKLIIILLVFIVILSKFVIGILMLII